MNGSGVPGVREGDPLSRRELEVLALVAAGESTAAVSRQLGIAENTVKTHLTRAYKKTGSRNRVQAVRFYLDRYGDAALPDLAARPAAAPPSDPAPVLIQRQIDEIEARIDELAPVTAEVRKLNEALRALRALDGSTSHDACGERER